MSRLIVAILLLLIAAAAVFFFVMPQWKEAQKIKADINGMEALHRELADLASSRDSLVQQYNAVDGRDLKKLEAIVPKGRLTSSALTDFEILVQKNGLSLERVDFSENKETSSGALPKPSSSSYSVMPVSLTLEGGYENFREFLKALELNLRLIDIEEIAFSVVENKDFPITIKGRIYYR